MPTPRAGVSLALLLAACGGGGGGGGGQEPPLALPAGQWSWLDVAGTQCADGSQTGLAVNPAPTSDGTLILFLDGGGACWDALSCAALQRAVSTAGGPFGEAEFQARLPEASGSILDRSLPGTPLGGATLVYIPYCTGDVHWGDSRNDYLGLGTWHHAGAANLRADVALLAQRLPAPEKLVVSGSSAGGYGALLAHDLARATWPSARGYLLDDCGPPLIGGDVPDAERTAWFDSWGLDRTLAPLCPGCRDDLSQILPTLAQRYPADRLALLSSRQDQVIRSFLLQTPDGFERALLQLVDERIAPLPSGRAFLTAGDAHAFLQDPAAHTSGAVPLLDWLGQLLGDDPAWATQGR